MNTLKISFNGKTGTWLPMGEAARITNTPVPTIDRWRRAGVIQVEERPKLVGNTRYYVRLADVINLRINPVDPDVCRTPERDRRHSREWAEQKQNVTRLTADAHGELWDPGDDDLLIKLLSIMPEADIATYLGRTHAAVQMRVCQLRKLELLPPAPKPDMTWVAEALALLEPEEREELVR